MDTIEIEISKCDDNLLQTNNSIEKLSIEKQKNIDQIHDEWIANYAKRNYVEIIKKMDKDYEKNLISKKNLILIEKNLKMDGCFIGTIMEKKKKEM